MGVALMQRKVALGLSCTVLCLLLMVGSVCTAKTTIKIANWSYDKLPQTLELVKDQLAAKGIEVEMVINTNVRYRDIVITQFLGGTGPDIIQETPGNSLGFLSRGLLMDLTPFLGKDPLLNFDRYITQTWHLFSYMGGTWLAPHGMTPYITFYNRDIFNTVGLTLPDETWTWENQIVTATKRLTRKIDNNQTDIYGLLLEGTRLLTPFFLQVQIFWPQTAKLSSLIREVHRYSKCFRNWHKII